MRIAGIVRDSIVDGVGVRDVIFTQGCPHHCEGCHNPQSWDFYGGYEMSIPDILTELKDSSNNITISGGEPLFQISELLMLVKSIHITYGKSIWIYTGCTYEGIPPKFIENLALWCDVLVDGKYEKDKKDNTLLFRGSSNQRLIDLPKSVKENQVVLWEETT
jgi:anaerobic ribonucleoside-triphosphate reductase activating protein